MTDLTPPHWDALPHSEVPDLVSREEYERVVWELTKSASRFDYCAAMLEESFSASGTRRAEMIIKAKHFALEARAAMETNHD